MAFTETSDVGLPGAKRRQWLTWLLPLVAFVAVYLSLFKWPNTPIWNPHSDFVQWLGNAQRMLYGDVMYRDFFHYLPPGTEMYYMACLKVFGAHAWLPNATSVFLGMVQTSLIFFIARRVLSDGFAALATMLFLGLGYRMLDPVHHWFSTSLLLAGIAVVISDRSTKRLIAAGILFGLTSFVTTPRGVLAMGGLGIFILYESWGRDSWGRIIQRWLVPSLAFIVTYAVVCAPFIALAGFERFYWSTVTYVLHFHALDERYAIIHGMWPEWNSPRGIIIYGSLLTYPIYFFGRRFLVKEGYPEKVHLSLALLSFVGLCQIAGVAHYANLFRVATICAPGFIVGIWLLSTFTRFAKPACAFLALASAAILVGRVVNVQRHQTFDFEAPIGRTTFEDEDQLKPYQWLLAHTRPNEYVFDGNAPNPYFLLGLRNPTNMYYVAPYPSTRPEQVAKLVDSLEKNQVRYIWWTVHRLSPGKGDPLPPLREYMHDHYHVAGSWIDRPYADTLEVWERNQ